MAKARQAVSQLQQALGTITLRADQRVLFEEHYMNTIYESYDRCQRSAYLFHSNRIIVTIGSVLVPALLSIQYNQTTTQFSTSIYWCTWFVSLLVTVSNGFLTLFKFDKKYFLFHATYEQLRSEGWQFLALTGTYHTKEPSTHEQQFTKFMHTVEKILMRQAQEQFIKLQDVNSAAPITTNAAGIPNLLEVSKSPAQDDLIIKIAKLLQSPPTVGGPSDQNVIETQTETQTRNTTIRDGEAKPVQLLD
jgi:hypothetical protein